MGSSKISGKVYHVTRTMMSIFLLLLILIPLFAYGLGRSSLLNQPQRSLSFLYKTRSGSYLRKIINKKWFSSLAGRYCDAPVSRIHIHSFVKKHDIAMDEAEKSIAEFTSFNDFFVRKLKKSARPIAPEKNMVVAPADGKILVLPSIQPTVHFPIKGVPLNLATLLNNAPLAQEYSNGTLCIIRLDPWDYHRFHLPLQGTIDPAIAINGCYESVNPLVYKAGIQPLTQNERRLMIIHTSAEPVLMISVGALCVGRIVETYTPHHLYTKGAEVGYFGFGGSTIVLIFKQGTIAINPTIIQNSLVHQETFIRMGESIGAYQTHKN